MEALAKGSRITGTQRTELAAALAQRYADGESLRALADDTGRSFGFVHGLIKESGVQVRGRGGATRGGTAAATTVPAANGTTTTDAHALVPAAAPDLKVKKSRAAAPKPEKSDKADKPDRKAKARKTDRNDGKKSKKGKKR
jgi:hypothetical protein